MTPDSTLSEIEQRHRERQAAYDYDKEATGYPGVACGPQYHQDIGTLLSILKSQPQAAHGVDQKAISDIIYDEFSGYRVLANRCAERIAALPGNGWTPPTREQVEEAFYEGLNAVKALFPPTTPSGEEGKP